MAGETQPAAAVQQLQERYGDELFRFAQRLTHSPDQARDVVQDVMLRAWRHPEIVEQDEGAVRAWLFTVTRNLVIDRWRSAAVRHEMSADLDMLGPGVAPVGEDTSGAVLDRWLIADALRTLTPEHRAVIVASYYQGRPVAEIARALRLPEGTVKSRLHYGLRSLRLILQEKGVTQA
jgi:RNA polymerase sigma-70 factor (ECF subfamily)